MNIHSTKYNTMAALPTKALNTESGPKVDSDLRAPSDSFTFSEGSSVSDIATGVALTGLAMSMGTFALMEAGVVPRGSGLELLGGLGGAALFVGGGLVGGVALLAGK